MSEVFQQSEGPAVDWVEVLREASGEEDQATARRAGTHLNAPIRAEVLVTVGADGRLIRWSTTGVETLTISQPLAEVDGRIAAAGAPTAKFGVLEEGWAAIAALIPSGTAFDVAEVGPTSAEAEVAVPIQELQSGREQGSLQLRVEAWTSPGEPARMWGGWWFLVDDRLYQVRRRGEEWVGVVRPDGSVAAEFTWAITGAIELLTSLAGARPGE
jgi:hypothetical protein